jgi:Cu/Zn superoxide dismutase
MKRLYLLCAALSLAACASITRGTTQNVAINTPNVSGATCTLTSNAIGTRTITTPAVTNLEKGKDAIHVICRKDCYDDGVAIIPSNFEGMTAGNILIGGVIGLGVDAATGAMNQYQNEVSVHMVKANSCKRKS